ncbi:MAG: iron-sulfur cluster assembly scaffold protein [candidate division WOR-3 bacterium]|nr:MAG: iron-sulfur cluster assembly scaffold protein [candidate division WOR-3 bacterium]
MKSTQYSEKVLDHFRKPRNVGTLEGDDVVIGRVGNPVCGDLMEFYVKVKDDRIEDIKFKTFGCGSAIATASMITELAKGKSIDEAFKITRQDVADELDGLPPIKMHCSNLAADALRNALNNYQKKKKPSEPSDTQGGGSREIAGADRFIGNGVFTEITDPSALKDKRVMVMEDGDRSLNIALELTKYTQRVVYVTARKDLPAGNLSDRVAGSKIKILFESEVLEIKGLNTVEKVLIHDLNEDEEYELFVDCIILPARK